ncbi:MAG: EamA family transporter RarD [Steroidobacteraceae bacterium]|nr:EamA family transporter RarD [Steroidobacteraceae bacterium]
MNDLSSSRAASAAAAPASTHVALYKRGFGATVGAFAIWGLFPLYLYGLTSVPALEITAHRVVWSCVFVLAWMAVRGDLGKLSAAIARPGVLTRLAASAILVSVNWLAFVWAINENRVVDVSLGYYINPLLNVVLGILVLSERLNRTQWIAVALAALGVAYLTVETGQLPWIALTLATSFGLYGLIRKTASVEALPGLAIEMILLVPFAVGFLIWCEMKGTAALGHSGLVVDVLLVASGIVTAVPLFLFSYGARLIPYSTVGVLQYLAPSMQLACAVLVFGEPFQRGRAVGFALIWAALIVYACDGLLRARRQKLSPA